MMMWGSFPWPMLLVIPAMIAVALFMSLRLMSQRSRSALGGWGPGCGFGHAPGAPGELAEPPAREDPMMTLRERYARGEIDIAEFEQRVDGLLRTEPDRWMPPRGR
ncbi:MAG: SHOCT domain-containing protein [Actinomycetota bacterium]|nr:SHOCT domain-containing protein [Actinomycetota bacterium]